MATYCMLVLKSKAAYLIIPLLMIYIIYSYGNNYKSQMLDLFRAESKNLTELGLK